MRISLIVTTRNEIQYIKNFLKSLYTQTKSPYEVIFVDANSKDGTIEEIKLFMHECRKHLNSQLWIDDTVYKEGGLSIARNIGVRESKGDYVTFVDTDGMLSPTFIENLKKEIEENPDMVGFQGSVLHPYVKILDDKFNKRKNKYVTYTTGCNMTFKKSLMEEFDTTVGWEDMDIGYRMSKKGKILFADSVLFIHFSNMTIKRYFRNGMNHVKWFRKYKDEKLKVAIKPFMSIFYYPLFCIRHGEFKRGMMSFIGQLCGAISELL